MVRLVASLLFAFGMLASVSPAYAADVPEAPSVALRLLHQQELTRTYLHRRADLLLVRAMFDVVAEEDIPAELVGDLRSMGADGPTADDLRVVERALLMEGSYFIVSLRYLLEAGVAAWPDDRPTGEYQREIGARLAMLSDEFVDAVETGQDPLSILRELVAMSTPTEGFTTLPPELDLFGRRDELVAAAIAQYAPSVSL